MGRFRPINWSKEDQIGVHNASVCARDEALNSTTCGMHSHNDLILNDL